MANPRAAIATSSSRQASQPAWYAAVVVGTAVFLGGLLVSHPAIIGYQAEALVLPAPSSESKTTAQNPSVAQPAIDLVAAEAWLKSDDTLSKLATSSMSSDIAAGTKSPSVAEVNELQKNLRLEVSERDGQSRLIVRFLGRRRASAAVVAERAAAELAGYLDRAADIRPRESEIAALRREVSLLDNEQRRLEDELSQQRYERLAATLVKESSELARHSSTVRQAAERQAPQVQRRAQLTQKIDELRIEYRTLVATRLADHPRVAAVAEQIEQLEAQLRELPSPASSSAGASGDDGPQFHIPAAGRSGGVTEAKFTSTRSVNVDEQARDDSDLGEVRQQLRDVVVRRKDAEIRLESALRLASMAWQKQWTVARGGSTQRLGGSPKNSDLLLATLLGVLAAGVVTIDWSLLWGRRVLLSAVQARNTMAAPLLGEIALPTAQPISLPESSGSVLKRRIVRMAEWMLIISLFLLFLAAMSQRELAGQLMRDPFGAMAEAFDTVRNAGR